MRIIQNELKLSVSVSTAFAWFKDLDKNYLKWHPPTHQSFVWLSDKPIGKGSKFYVEENIEGHNHKLFMVITEFIENEKLSFVSLSIHVKSKILPDQIMRFLSSIFRIRIEMNRTFKSVSDNETIIHTTHNLCCHVPVINKLIEWFIGMFIFSSKYHENHMKEENEYMRLSLEKG